MEIQKKLIKFIQTEIISLQLMRDSPFDAMTYFFSYSDAQVNSPLMYSSL